MARDLGKRGSSPPALKFYSCHLFLLYFPLPLEFKCSYMGVQRSVFFVTFNYTFIFSSVFYLTLYTTVRDRITNGPHACPSAEKEEKINECSFGG